MHDVIVVGGGPGGLYASWCLARKGFSVLVVEQHDTAGKPGHSTGGLAPEGFAWVVPVRRAAQSHARIGLMCEGNAALYFERFVERVSERWQLQTEGMAAPRPRILPLAPIRKTYSNRLLVVGDAAGLVK